MKKHIVIAVGGSGGHIFPAMCIGRALQKLYSVSYMGVGLSTNTFFNQKEPYYEVEGKSLSQGIVRCVRHLAKGFWKSKKLLREIGASKVLGFGSFHSFPVLAAALYLQIPYCLYELNTIAGRTNWLFSYFAKESYVNFPLYKRALFGCVKKIDYVFETKVPICQKKALQYFGLEEGKKTVLIFGGSQGSEFLHRLVIAVLDKLQESYQVLILGRGETEENSYACVKMFSFCDRMDLAWTACDFAVCRSGAGTIREMLIYEKPALLIPYPQAKDDHQKINAQFMQKEVGGGHLVEEGHLTKKRFLEEIFFLEKRLPFLKLSMEKFKKRGQSPHFMEAIDL